MLTISDLYDLHNLCVEAIQFWENAPYVLAQETRTNQINRYKKLIDKLEEERKKL